MPITTLESTTAAKRLRLMAGIAAILAVLQTVLAVTLIITDNEVVARIHEGFGFLYMGAAIITVFPAWVWGTMSKNNGLIGHATGMAVAAIVQVILGLAAEPTKIAAFMFIHMGLGLVILLGAVGLYVMSSKKPIIVTNVDGSRRRSTPDKK